MDNKAIIMEINDDYTIVMTSDFEFKKIKNKKNMLEGQQIYIIDEDIIYDIKPPFYKNKKFLLILLAILSAIVLSTFLLKSFMNDSYATISLDGKGSIQLYLNKEQEVIDAISRDESLSQNILNNLKGNSFDDIIHDIEKYIKNDNYVLVSYYISDEDPLYIDSISSNIKDSFENAILIKADKQDKEQAKKDNKTLGQEKIKFISSLSALEQYIDDKKMNYYKLDKFVLTHSNFLEKSELIRSEILEKQKQNSDDDNNDNDDDNDDGNDDD